MILWRISRHRDLGGTGGLRSPGRWHHAGQPIVYLAETAAGALLEVCVHTSANDVPPDFTLLKIEAPEIQVQAIQPDELPAGWQSHPDFTRDLGTAWLQKKDTALLSVPSAILPETVNFLLNPAHPDAKKSQIVEALLYPFDVRLKK
jgi:RES domain-containing protein